MELKRWKLTIFVFGKGSGGCALKEGQVGVPQASAVNRWSCRKASVRNQLLNAMEAQMLWLHNLI